MKKIVCLIMVLAFSISLFSCNTNTNQTEKSEDMNTGTDFEESKEPTYDDLYEKLGTAEQEFLDEHGMIIVSWFYTKNDKERFLSLEGVYEDESGNLYFDILNKNEKKVILATPKEDYNPDSITSRYTYSDGHGFIRGERLNLDTDAITECLLLYIPEFWALGNFLE